MREKPRRMPTRKAKNIRGAAKETGPGSGSREHRGGDEGPSVCRDGAVAGDIDSDAKRALDQLQRENERLRHELVDARTRIVELERLADEDALVPVANRRAFMRELTRVIAFAERYGLPASVIYFDVNGMKQINDAHGHLAGDAALRHMAKLLRDNIRSSDTLGRLGGDEFGVILAQSNADQANRKAAALAEIVAATPLQWDAAEIVVSAAYGVYSFNGGEDAQVAIDAADREMYRQKRGGEFADSGSMPS
jgi:diguanylate cyclase (GGDEF)-like protein